MKELSIKEKARRYDEAIEIAKDINNEQRAQPFNVMTRVFPELAEDDDEKIRKELLNYLYDVHDDDEERARWIAWLEKEGEKAKYHDMCDKCVRQPTCQSDCFLQQGEQKPVVPKFKIGDKVKKGYLTYTVEDIDEDSYKLQAYSKDGDKGCTVFLTIGYEKDYELVEQKPEWSDEDEAVLDALIRRLEGEDIHVSPHLAVKCLKSLKDRVQLKQEWSEEDEIHQLHAISLIEDIKDWANKDGMHSLCIERCIESIDWLILLKERCCPQIGDYHEGFEKGFAKAKAMNCHWKPSDEQIKQLNITVNMLNPNRHDKHVLTSLLEDLKKL